MLMRKYSVVAYGNRDEYQIPFALHEVNALSRLLTDFYSPDWLVFLARRIRLRSLGHKVNSRSHPHISSAFSQNCLLAKSLYSLFLRFRGIPVNERDRYLDSLLSRIALTYAFDHTSDALLCYSYYWEAIALSHSLGIPFGPFYFFQVHPCVSQIQSIVRADRATTGLTYLPEPEEIYPPNLDDNYIACLRSSSGVIAASSFTVQGLADRGVDASKMRVVPYGAINETAKKGAKPPPHGALLCDSRWRSQHPMRLLWVGQLAYRKAPHHLFSALSTFSCSQVQLTLVTRSEMPDELAALCPDNVRVVTRVNDSLKTSFYSSHHLFVLPSLVEGFGLVYLEALAAGLPILGSSNSGAPDVIEHGVHGFIVQPGDPDAIREIIDACLSDPSLLSRMAINALSLSRSLTWSRFRAGIRQSLAEFELTESL